VISIVKERKDIVLKKYRKFNGKRYKLRKVFISKRDAQREKARFQLDDHNTRIITAQLWRAIKPEKLKNKSVLEYRLYTRKKSKR